MENSRSASSSSNTKLHELRKHSPIFAIYIFSTQNENSSLIKHLSYVLKFHVLLSVSMDTGLETPLLQYFNIWMVVGFFTVSIKMTFLPFFFPFSLSFSFGISRLRWELERKKDSPLSIFTYHQWSKALESTS